MALVNCKECGKDVSSSAVTCPHCGIDSPAKTNCLCCDGEISTKSMFCKNCGLPSPSNKQAHKIYKAKLVSCRKCSEQASSKALRCQNCKTWLPYKLLYYFYWVFIPAFVVVLLMILLPNDDEKIQQNAQSVKKQQTVSETTSSSIPKHELTLVANPPFPAIPTAFVYNDVDVTQKGNRIWASVSISAPEAKTLEQRVATAMLAAYDMFFEANAQTAYIFLDKNAKSAGRAEHLARVIFTADGCGVAGDRCDGVVWQAEATGEQQNADGTWPETIIFRDKIDFSKVPQVDENAMREIRP